MGGNVSAFIPLLGASSFISKASTASSSASPSASSSTQTSPQSVSGSTGASQGGNASMFMMMLMGMSGIGLYIWSAITVANAHSASEDYGVLKNTVPMLIGQTLVATLLLYGAMLLYVIQDLNAMIYILIAMVFLTFSFAYGAVAIAAMSR
jgi:hypothetical protein